MTEDPPTILTGDDEREIAAVMLRYCTGIDRRDWPLFRTCFTDDVHAEYGNFGDWTSADAITEAMERMHREVGATLHRVSNIVSAGIAGGASSRTYVDAILNGKNPADPSHQAIGYYDDELVRTAAGWKIKRRRFTLVRQ